jgi:glutaminase
MRSAQQTGHLAAVKPATQRRTMPAIRNDSPIGRYLESLHERFRKLDDGAVATYIPELALADPSWFGISVATADGYVYEVGDTRQPFTIQSISKPFVYGLALEDRGKAAVLEKIGVEPTGDAFNEVSLESPTGRPRNPMINAGAIAATSLVRGDSPEDRWERILALFSLYAGRKVAMNEAVYRSERDTGHRNRAISHMLRNFGIIRRDPEPDLDLYFRQCSIEVDCRDLSIIGATLATGGVNPVTRERVIRADHVDEVLSVMTTCGMYDYAGEWVYRVGLPAKSGVAGGILAVMPGQLAVAVFSPRLDARGNSVRGVAVCEAFSEDLELHFLRAPRPAISAVRARFTARSFPSKRRRLDVERDALAAHGDRIVTYQLQGDLSFAGAEIAIRRLVTEPTIVTHLVLDFGRVTGIDLPSARLLLQLLVSFAARGRQVALVGLARQRRLLRELEEIRAEDSGFDLLLFDEYDVALESAENSLLRACNVAHDHGTELSLAKHDLLQNLSPDQVELLAAVMERREYRARQIVVRRGEPANELFLLVHGELSVLTDTPDGHLHRLSTLAAGMAFGEQSIVEGSIRTAFVRADVASVCWVLSRSAFDSLELANPELKIRLLENLLRSATQTLGRLSFEVLAERA